MAILTLAEFKASATYLLNTSIFSDDTINAALISEAEKAYLSVRGKPFKKITGTYTSGAALISSIPTFDMVGLIKGQRAADDNIRGEIIDIDEDNLKITVDSNATDDGAAVELFIYPMQSKEVAIELVNYLRSAYTQDLTKKSESIEKHSWTNWGSMDTRFGIPKNIASRIKSYVSVKEGMITGRGFYKGRQEISVSDNDQLVNANQLYEEIYFHNDVSVTE